MKKEDKKKELEKEIRELDKEYKIKEKQIKSSPEFVDLGKEADRLGKEIKKLNKRQEEIEKEIANKFLDDGISPSYSKGNSWDAFSGNKNIRQEVLNSIKRSLGIKNLSLLKGSDIVKITQKLIDKEEYSNKELQKTLQEIEKNDDRIREIGKKQNKMLEKIEDIYDKSRVLNNELYRIREMEEKAEKLKDPKKRAYAERWKTKEEAEKKLENNFNEVVENVRVNVIKEKIVNSLEDNEED